MSFCDTCGRKVREDDQYCQKCGNKLLEEGEEREGKTSRKTASKKKLEEEYTCPHCDKDFTVEDLTQKEIDEGFSTECPHCGEEVEVEGEEESDEAEQSQDGEQKVVERVVEKEYHHEKSKGSGIGGFILLLIVLGLIGVVAFFVIQSGALDDVTSGSGIPYVDPCERDLNQCNHACGEGILNSVCKEKCTYQYNQCKKS